ncbi:MAG: amino acid permease [Firmicutes bacterium]|nr:amino acid permease [Bacillota bacterium]
MENRIDKKALDRYLHPVDVWGMAFGCMVGWGAFVMPGTTFLPVAGPAGTILAMLIGMGVMLIIAQCMSFLMQRSPRTGGIYSYTKEAFGRDHAFLCAWFLCLSYLTVLFLNGSALFVVIRTILGDNIQTGLSYTVAGSTIYVREVATSILALACIGLLFIAAKAILQRLHTILALILAAGVIVAAILCLPGRLPADAFRSFGTQGVNPVIGVFSLVILAPWAFVGFEVVTFDTAHFRFPVKKTGGILLAALFLAAFAYIAMALVSITVHPDGFASWSDYIVHLGELGGIEAVPTFYAAKTIIGSGGLAMIAVTAFAAILTGIIGAYRATMRVLSTMAEDKILSDHFSKTSYSILFIMLLSILISLLGRNTLIWFVDLTAFGAIVAYGYTCAAASRAAKSENNAKIVWAGRIGTVIAVSFAVVQLVPRLAAIGAMGSEAFLLLSLWCFLGFVYYWRTIHRSSLTEYSGMSISGTILFALLVYAALMWIAKQLYAKESIEAVRAAIVKDGVVLFLLIFVGLWVMLYIQKIVRRKHEEAEREKIRAVEGSLAKSQFLFNMSHDIRTPMNAIIGYTNLAREEKSPEVVKEYLGKIDTSSRHLLDLINDILEMSRIESGRPEVEYEPADLCRIFEELGSLFEEQMKQKDLRFAVHDTQVEHRYAWCDKKNLNRVLLNLVSNSYKFTPAGGEISVTLFETGSENGYGSYEMRVQDNGIGMSKEFVEKMFNAFERERTSTDSGVEGTGLGLAITKSLVDLMGGTIEVLTSPGSGTQIIIRLKMRLAEEAELGEKAAAASEGAQEIDLSQKTVLLVEDNQINMEIARMILEQKGLTVEPAENGQIALDKVKSSEPGAYDAILMDIQMPVMDGYTAAKAIRALDDPAKANVPILAMTANAFREDVQAALDAGMQAHIAKPIDVDVLMGELKKVLS